MMVNQPDTQPSPVVIAQSEQRQLFSSRIGQEYLVKVWLPENYSEHQAAYPVLYLLDGDFAFGMATDIVQYLIYGQHIPDLLIISPAYGSKNEPHEGGINMRERDLLPFPTDWSRLEPSGEQFLQFIQHELIPFAETHYHIDRSKRTIWGYSLGGVFALYALFSQPDLFQRYIVVDGFLEDHLLQLEAAYANQHPALPAKVFLAAPSEAPPIVEAMVNRKYADSTLVYDQLSALGHFAIGAEGLTKGLVSVFGM